MGVTQGIMGVIFAAICMHSGHPYSETSGDYSETLPEGVSIHMRPQIDPNIFHLVGAPS